MSGISDIQEELLSESVLLDILREGRIPSLREVRDRVLEITRGRDLSKPLLDLQDGLVERGEASSAAKWNLTQDQLLRDLQVLYDASLEVGARSADAFGRTMAEMDSILARIREMEDRLESVLLTRRDSAGYHSHVSDVFTDMSKVDQASTTAFVDLRAGVVHAMPRLARGGGVSNRHGELVLRPERRAVRASLVATGAPGEMVGGTVVGMPLENVWSPSDRIAMFRVSSSSRQPVMVTWTFDIALRTSQGSPDEHAQWISKFLLEPMLTMESGPITANLQFRASNREPEWRNVPTPDFLRTVTGRTAWSFERTRMVALRLLMTKTSSDRVRPDGRHEYDFGIRRISMYDQTYDIHSEEFEDSILVTSDLSALDRNGNRVRFDKVSLDACESLPEGTDIDWQVDFGVDGAFSGTWSPIVPLEREGGAGGKVVSFARVEETTVTGITIMTGAKGIGTTQNFREHGGRHVRVLGREILETDLQRDWKIWRNVARNDDNFSIIGNDHLPVETGWRSDGTWFECMAYVEEVEGRSIDFGPRGLFVNDIFATGQVHLSRGAHKIRTHRDNWHSLDGLNNVSSFNEATRLFSGGRRRYGADGQDAVPSQDDLAGQSSVDPLWPFNHKLLLEGLDFHPDFPESRRVYRGVARVASELMRRVGLQDFVANVPDSDLTRWAPANIIDDIGGTTSTRPILKVPEIDNAAVGRELFTLVRRNSSGTMADSLRLRAVLRTNDPARTPVLEGYRVKLGN